MADHADIDDAEEVPANGDQDVEDLEQQVEEHFGGQELALVHELQQPAQNIVVMYQNFINAPLVQMAQLPPAGAANPIEVLPADGDQAAMQVQIADLRNEVDQLRADQRRTSQCVYLTAAVSVLTGLSTALGIYFSLQSLAPPRPRHN